jgi:glycosyltransferase involved in cell wall biosynthesis
MISVITPVYNADSFLHKSIESVLMQEEVSEYILIDDGSTDKSWEIINLYAQKDNRIIALKHSDYKNHGRSKSRNLGLATATKKYIAFLDADDIYLVDRFKNDLKILKNDSNIDGVYNAIGVFYYDSYIGEKNVIELTTLSENISSDKLFENMAPFGNKGWFSGDGLIVKKIIFDKIGFFNEDLEVAEDTELWVKMSLVSTLVGGIIDKPVSLRGVHDSNVFNQKEKYVLPRLKMYRSLVFWAFDNPVSKNRKKIILEFYYRYLNNIRNNKSLKLNFYSLMLEDIQKNYKIILYKEFSYVIYFRIRHVIIPFLYNTVKKTLNKQN